MFDDAVILWRRADGSGHESARLAFADGRWHIAGTAVFVHDTRPCRLDFVVSCNERWETTSAFVEGWMGRDPVLIDISVDSARRWWLNGEECLAVEGCIDVDLGFSPSTNQLPIRRLALSVGETADVSAAWLGFPSLRMEPLEQQYRRLDHDRYEYSSRGRSFVAQLRVNGAGMVVEYEGLWRAEAEQ